MNYLPNMTAIDWHGLIINAARYAINRNTYASSVMAEILARNADYIAEVTCAILIRDIEAEMARNAINEIDLPRWKEALAKLKEAQE